MKKLNWLIGGFACLVLSSCDGKSTYVHRDGIPPQEKGAEAEDPPEVSIGEKLFREGRFSQFFYANSKGRLNHLPAKGDTIVEKIESLTQMYDGPYRGQTVSCAACHFVDQAKGVVGLGMRAYTDFSRRSRIPDRGDGESRTVRNSPNMVAMALKDGMFLHADGEFTTPEDLVRAGFLGRNMGWLVDESRVAIHHIAEIVRRDSGKYPTDTDLGGINYKDLLAGSKNVPEELLLAPKYRIDVSRATDEQVFSVVTKLVAEYLRSLDYIRDENGNYIGTPYDVFLRKNNLPRAPAPGESSIAYSNRLIQMVETIDTPNFVNAKDGQFKLQAQPFVFSERELDGLKVFFGRGKCVQCHSAPDFTDHLFHNTGISQDEYDQLHGSGSFMRMRVPKLADRNSAAEVYLPPSEAFPRAKSQLRSIPTLEDARRADLGVWAVFANPTMPKPQSLLRIAICQSLELNCVRISDEELLDASLGMIKTPSVRDLGQSAPYLHAGQANTLEDVLSLYMKNSDLARVGKIRNADPRLSEIHISVQDSENLTLFLKSLNEDYE